MNSLLAKIYLYKFLDDFVIIYPLYALMFSDYGISPVQIGTLFTIWSVVTFLLEIPSGVWADKYSRKNILFLGQLLRAVGYSVWIIFPTFIGFLIGFIFWGVKSALASGTFEALVYDELKNKNLQANYSKILGNSYALSSLGILLASLLSSIVFLYGGYNFILALSVVAVIISGVIVFLLPKVQIHKSTEEKKYLYLLRTGFKEIFSHNSLFIFLIFSAFVGAISGGLDEFWGIFGSQSGLPDYTVGTFVAVLSGLHALGSFIANKFGKMVHNWKIFFFILIGLLLVVSGISSNYFGLLIFGLYVLAFAIYEVILENRFQEQISSETRATTSSVKGFFLEVFAVGVYMLFGFLAQKFSYSTSFTLFGMIIILSSILYVVVNKTFKKDSGI